MLKAAAGNLVVLGLSDANVRELRRDNPIVFDLADLQGPGVTLPAMPVCIAYKRPDHTAGFPVGFDGIGLCLSDNALDNLDRCLVELSAGEVRFVLFHRATEALMEQELRSLIGPKTRVTHSGFAPSDKPAGRN